MDSDRFDSLVMRLSGLKNRREGLRLLLATAGGGGLAAGSASDAVACKGDRARCDRNKDCCSRKCRKGRRGKRRCLCSAVRDRCKRDRDCCSFFRADCGDNGCDAGKVCCLPFGAQCGDDCDCCGIAICDNGRCQIEGCRLTQEACERTSECCQDDEICDQIDPACNPAGEKVCCGTAGSACTEDCDCCQPFECDEDLAECVAPTSSCLPGEVACLPSNPVRCCQEGETCCTDGPSPECCQAGTVCSVGGCQPPQPPCPEDADSCGSGEAPCGEGPLFAGCKCYRRDDQTLCARLSVCDDCQDDARCVELLSNNPTALCIPCPLCTDLGGPPNACVVPCGA